MHVFVLTFLLGRDQGGGVGDVLAGFEEIPLTHTAHNDFTAAEPEYRYIEVIEPSPEPSPAPAPEPRLRDVIERTTGEVIDHLERRPNGGSRGGEGAKPATGLFGRIFGFWQAHHRAHHRQLHNHPGLEDILASPAPIPNWHRGDSPERWHVAAHEWHAKAQNHLSDWHDKAHEMVNHVFGWMGHTHEHQADGHH
jgi:hypothetical protein